MIADFHQEIWWQYLVLPIALVLGTVKLVMFLLDSIDFVRRHCFRQKMDHFTRYGGKGTWALVTGATDGIGLEFCKQLAKEGFNICLVSRTESKLKGVAENDLKQYGVQTEIVVANFSKNSNMTFYDDIMEKVKDIDIGLVVLNAGISHPGFVER